jgi:cytochrome oxidase assembly protein ShyY1
MNNKTLHQPHTSTQVKLADKEIRFTPSLVPTIGSVITISILLSLCVWQIMRHFERNIHVDIMDKNRDLGTLSTLGDPLTIDIHLYRRFALQGHFIGPRFLEAGRAFKGHYGYAVFQLFKTINGSHILVDRGDLRRSELNTMADFLIDDPEGVINGQLRPILNDEIGPPVNERPPLIWRRQSISKIHHWTSQRYSKRKPISRVYLRIGEEYEIGKQPHQSPGSPLATGYLKPSINWDSAHYAVQWLCIAGIIFIFWLWVSFGRPWSD